MSRKASIARGIQTSLCDRDPLEFYPTPAWVTEAIVRELQPRGVVIDPCCGDGAILLAISAALPDHVYLQLRGIEIHEGRVAEARQHCGHPEQILCADAFRAPAQTCHYVIMNPPFTRALDFATLCLRDWTVREATAMLAPLSFLASAERQPFLAEHMPDVFTIPIRPRFEREKDGTGSQDYAWFVWPGTETPLGCKRDQGCIRQLKVKP